MKIQNKIAKTIDITEEKAKYDEHCKKLISFKIFLAHILKGCVSEFKDFDVNDIANKYIEGEPIISEAAVHQDEKVIGMNAEDLSVLEKTVRYFILCFCTYIKSGCKDDNKYRTAKQILPRLSFAKKRCLLLCKAYICTAWERIC